jgi:chromosomal replication initiation ATPase DnaA
MTPHGQSMQIIMECAREHGVSIKDVIGSARFKSATAARWKACRRLRDKGLSYAQIGMKLNRDHTTVMYAIRRMREGINAWEGCKDNGKRDPRDHKGRYASYG